MPRLIAIGIAAWMASAAAHAEPDLARAEELIRAGKTQEAWTLLAPHEFELAGRERFDYLLGIAALETGRPGLATLIFERVLVVNPNHAAARLDMARAYYVQGDHTRARTEFEAVLHFDPPPPARATIDRYLAAIAGVRGKAATRLSGYVEATLGRDSNLNAGASGGTFYFPLFSASVASTRKPSNYAAAGAGLDAVHALHPTTDLLAGIDVRQRAHDRDWVDDTKVRRTDFYDSRSLDGRLGIQYRPGPRDALRVTVSRGEHQLNGTEPYRRNMGVLAEWRRTEDARHQWGAFVLDQRLRYGTVDGAAYRMYGGDQLIAGVGGIRVLQPERAAFVYGSLFSGGERATDLAAGNLDGDKQLAGVRVGGQIDLWPTVLVQASVGLLGSRYELDNPLFLSRRKDLQADLSLTAQWRFTRDWQLRPQYQYTRSDSNFGAYDYRRHDLSLTVRYDWR